MASPRPISIWLIFTTTALNAAARAPPAFDVATRAHPCHDSFGPPSCSSFPKTPRSGKSASTDTTTSSSSSRSSSNSSPTTRPTAPSSHPSNTSTPSPRFSPTQSTSVVVSSSGTTKISTSFALAADGPFPTSSRASPPVSPPYPPAARLVSTSSSQDTDSLSPTTPANTVPSSQNAGNSTASTSFPSSFASSVSPTASIPSTTSMSPTSPQSLSGTTTTSSLMSEVSSASVNLVAPTSSSTPAQERSPPRLTTGGIIGVIVAILGFFWLAALALWWLFRKWRASKMQDTRTGGTARNLGTPRYEQADANEAPPHDTAAPAALHPASHHELNNKEVILYDSSPAPPSRPHSPLPNPSPLASEAARCRSESPTTLVDRPLSITPSRPESLKNTELLALAGTDYSTAVARARSRSSSTPQPYATTSMAELHAAFGAELVRTSTNPFRERLHAAEIAQQKASMNTRPGDDDDQDWWAGQRA